MKIIAISNLKGGVAKTTTAINLGAGLARKGRSVLLVDLDPQAHTGTALGLRPEPGVFYLLTMGTGQAETTFVKQYVRQTGRENLWLMPGDQTTQAAQIVIQAKNSAMDVVRSALERFRKGSGPDYIILDTAPSVGGILERAVWAADLVIVPTSTEYLSTDSVRQMVEMMATMARDKGWRGALLGVQPTMYQDQLREHRAALEDLGKVFGERVLAPIHRAAVLGECPGESKTIFEKAPASRAAVEYAGLCKLVMKY